MDEHQRHGVPRDGGENVADGVAGEWPAQGTRSSVRGWRSRAVRRLRPPRDRTARSARRALRHQPAAQFVAARRPWRRGRRCVRPGAMERRRARPRARRSPRLEVTSACNSSSTTVSRSEKKVSASPAAMRSASCSGVVSRMSGGNQLLALAARGGGVAGAGLHGDGQAHLRHGLFEVALDVDGERLQRRDVERVDGRGGGFPASRRAARRCRSGRAGNPASVLPAAGRRDQERGGAAGVRVLPQRQLMRTGRHPRGRTKRRSGAEAGARRRTRRDDRGERIGNEALRRAQSGRAANRRPAIGRPRSTAGRWPRWPRPRSPPHRGGPRPRHRRERSEGCRGVETRRPGRPRPRSRRGRARPGSSREATAATMAPRSPQIDERRRGGDRLETLGGGVQ